MKTKPFDLRAALAGAKLVTESGNEVVDFRPIPARDLRWDKPFEAKVIYEDGTFSWLTFTAKGENSITDFSESDLLLVDETEEITATVPDEPRVNLTMLYTRLDYLCQRVDSLERMLEEQNRMQLEAATRVQVGWGRRKGDYEKLRAAMVDVANENRMEMFSI